MPYRHHDTAKKTVTDEQDQPKNNDPGDQKIIGQESTVNLGRTLMGWTEEVITYYYSVIMMRVYGLSNKYVACAMMPKRTNHAEGRNISTIGSFLQIQPMAVYLYNRKLKTNIIKKINNNITIDNNEDIWER